MAFTVAFPELEPRERYKLLCATIVPRPIALVTSVSAHGVVNAAPFSFFNVFSEDPPLIVLGLQHKLDTAPKDTTRNIAETGVFVVNLVDEGLGRSHERMRGRFPARAERDRGREACAYRGAGRARAAHRAGAVRPRMPPRGGARLRSPPRVAGGRGAAPPRTRRSHGRRAFAGRYGGLPSRRAPLRGRLRAPARQVRAEARDL